MASRVSLLLLLLFPLLSQATHLGPRRVGPIRHLESFGSFNDLEGSRKGEKREGIQKAKQYLQRYGYMSIRTNTDDQFDETLESSLKAFQTFYGLKATGILDSPTAELMSMARCGVPDQVFPAAAAAGGINRLGYEHLNISSHYVFWPFQKWSRDKMHIHYIVDPDGHPEEPITKGFDAWSAVSNFTFERVREDSRAKLKVFFQPLDGPNKILAHASVTLVDPMIRFDPAEEWVVGAFPDSFDLQSVATHEMGHILGLAHTNDSRAVMYAPFSPNQVRPLGQDDIDGITALYST